ncbi:hypothetical protein BO79DRAFT_208569 [Aspergillus costaricaensis CBS 115574]|uniref:Uncharacterized protein n=1 Tax=Aspergillus costaricaensis CBS 115574 TaxID=1448317 RepID=A0ACD1III9_9EURO|nr:hypothetical protein BO79DRAFT_208569 [Aspergillus costaricaensis CBS 115574]RAK89840.1 hypothetical protein BO79DRAFT_208569 [Aspergillus costaricaensis CBS 115574]
MSSFSTEWEVSSLTVNTGTADGATDTLYANGRMQVPVYVSISAIDPDKNVPYSLTEAELESIKLVDYYSTSTELSGDWVYSTIENEFAHSGTTSLSLRSTSQSIKFWVSTSKVEKKSIAASVKQPDGKIVTTHESGFDYHATLVGNPPINYTTDNITIQDTKSGDGSSGSYSWSLLNYYISTNDHDLAKADLFIEQAESLFYNRDHMVANLYTAATPSSVYNLLYVWEYGDQATKLLGPYNLLAETPAVTVNDKKNNFCLTMMSLTYNYVRENEVFVRENHFTLYDIYGNSGKFKAELTDGGEVVIHNMQD